MRAKKEGDGHGRFRARFVHCGGGGGVPGLPIRRQKNAANAMTATMITITPTTIRTVFSPPGSKEGGGVSAAKIVMLPHIVTVSEPNRLRYGNVPVLFETVKFQLPPGNPEFVNVGELG